MIVRYINSIFTFTSTFTAAVLQMHRAILAVNTAMLRDEIYYSGGKRQNNKHYSYQ